MNARDVPSTVAAPVPLRLVMTLLLSDEDDLVEPCLDYHFARGVDFAIVTANRASEAVLAKLAPYVDRGLVHLVHEPAHTYAQSEWVTRMARLAATEHAADWVLNCDPDEFYWPQAGSLKEILAAIPPPYGSLHMAVCHFPPRPHEGGSFLEQMTVREIRSLKPGIPVQFAKVAHRATANVVVVRGNHKVSGPGLDPLPAWRPIIGLHFPLRSYAQFERKVIRDGEAVANNPDRKISQGVWRDLYELYRAGRLRDDYATRVLDDAAAQEGLEAGRLVVDGRLRDFFRAGLEPAITVGAPADGERVRSLGRKMRQAIQAAEREPPFLEIQRLTARLQRIEAKRDALRHSRGQLEDRLARAQAKRKAAVERAKALEVELAEVRAELAGSGRRRWMARRPRDRSPRRG